MGGDRKYDADFHAWTHEQATLLRSGRLSEIDVEHIAEEIETLEMNVARDMLPGLCPYRFEQALDEAFWPDRADG